MPSLFRRDLLTLVWLGLVLATATTWWVGADHGLGRGDAAALLVIAIAFVKVRFVGLHFMELRTAPRALRLAFEGYLVVTAVTLGVLYLVG